MTLPATMDHNHTIYFEKLESPSIGQKATMEMNQAPCWMDPIRFFLENGELPSDHTEAQRIERKVLNLPSRLKASLKISH